MQTLCPYFLIVVMFATIYGKYEINDVHSIAGGLSFGMCFGYCQQSINATSDPLQIVFSKAAHFAHDTYPPIQQSYSISSDQWNELISLLNLKIFAALSNIIGCPDCADGGAEWIQVNWIGGSKRVTFEYGRTINGIEEFIERLRQLRKEYSI